MKDNNKSLHDEHRQRMRQKYLTAKDSLADHEILEILLYHSLPRKNTNHIAHKLCKHFGSLRAVFEADMSELIAIDEVGESTAFLIKQILYLWKRCEEGASHTVQLDSITALGNYLTALFSDETEEAVYLLMLDHDAKLIACRKLLSGSISACESDARKIAEIALSHKAPRIVLAHNHPAGNAELSDSDISTTRYLRRVFLGIDLALEEHFIVAGNTYCPIISYLNEEFHTK